MLLIVVATDNEIQPLKQFISDSGQLEVLVTGMGPAISAASLSHYLALYGSSLHGVINIGVGGAYVGSGLNLLDIPLPAHTKGGHATGKQSSSPTGAH